MKDFALKLEGCSKEDRKEVVKLAKSVGYKYDDEDRFKSSNWASLRFDSENMVMWYSRVGKSGIKNLYQMPQDMPKLKEALWIEVPKDGEVWVRNDRVEFWVSRFKRCSESFNYHHSSTTPNDSYFTIEGGTVSKYLRKATPQEEAFEAQEAKKPINYKDYIKRTDLLVENAELKQTIKTLSSSADILANDNAELIKKLYKIKGIL